jgi:predicted Ser/Thr protein kinase
MIDAPNSTPGVSMEAVQRLGKYEIRGTLGRGAMGTVYDGWDPVIARRVAIKTVPLPENPDPETAEEIARFKREAQAAGRLTHPNIVAVYDYGETNNLAYIVMEFVDGPSLKTLLDKQERFPTETIGRVMADVLAGLQFSHERGVVHRDIKPANVMLSSDGRAKIADFGIARIEASSMTQAGTMLGTPAYMSPEQFMGQVVDARTDVYSAGVMLYQLLTGERPFDGGLTAIMHKVLNTEPPPPSELAVTSPAPLDPVVKRAMAKRPDDRFPSASAFAEALQAALAEAPAKPAAAPVDAESTLLARPGATSAAATPPRAAPTRSRLPLLVGVAVAAVVIVAGGAFLLLRSPSAPPPAPAPQKVAEAAPAPAPPKPAEATPAPAPAPQPTAEAPPKPAAETTPPPTEPAPSAQAQPAPASPAPQVQPVPSATVQPAPATTSSPPPPAAPQAAQAQPEAQPTPVAAAPPAAAAQDAPPPLPAPAQPVAVAPSPPPAETKLPASAAPPPAQKLQPVVQAPPLPTPAPSPPPPAAKPAAQQEAAAGGGLAGLRQQLAEALKGAQCALAEATVQESGRISVAGFAGSNAAPALKSDVATLAGGHPLDWRVRAVDPVFCPALAALRPVAAGEGLVLSLASGRTALHDGERILPRITMADFSGELRVDYLGHDRSIVHLYPTVADPVQHYVAVPGRRLSPGTLVTLGDNGPGQPEWEVGPPYGTDMIIAVASSTPLFTHIPAQNAADDAAPYLDELARAIVAARAGGAHVSAAALLVDTLPKEK